MSVGRVLSGRYELLRLIGRGGMAEVFAARDLTLGRLVAVKLLLDRFLDDEAFTRRFQDEARHVARLNHPNLVAVYDTGNDEGQPYMVMELVEGDSLQQVISNGSLTERRALEIVGDVCAALSYAHDRGLIHRDVKPGNILIADDGSVKVTDFGIARAVDNETVTRTASVLGTAAYLSPEQAQGLDVDERSDLYSLGVVLYEALTGSQPFSGDTPVTVAYQHVQETPRPPRDLHANVSPAAEAIAMRALAKNPNNRYQHAEEMRDDVVNALQGRAVVAPAVMTADETALLQPRFTDGPTLGHERQQRRRMVVFTILGVLAVVALVTMVWFLVSLLQRDAGPQVTVPNVVGEQLEVAIAIIEDHSLTVGDVTEEASDTVPAGVVLRQRPVPDLMVAEDTPVDLVVSAGQETTVVPNLIGLTEEQALSRLVEDRLRGGDRQREFSDEVPEGQVMAQSPAAGDEVPVGTPVSYVVSAGEEIVVVRPVENRSEQDAIFRLEDQGLEVRIEREHSSGVSEGFVISQDPSAGTEVRVGTLVTIVVSLGPEEPDEEEAPEEPSEPPSPPPGPPDPDPDPGNGDGDGGNGA